MDITDSVCVRNDGPITPSPTNSTGQAVWKRGGVLKEELFLFRFDKYRDFFFLFT